MGYTTDFNGEFKLDKPLKSEHAAYLRAFSERRRMKRAAEMTNDMPDVRRKAVGLPIGEDGEYFAGDPDRYGQTQSADILNYNSPPGRQPGLWCQWVPNEDGTAIVHDCGEKFYEYKDWIKYLVERFIKPWGYVLNGRIDWWGEDRDDIGRIVIVDNHVEIFDGEITYSRSAKYSHQ